jgi:RNA polymerase sigma-70 factor (ECF subfamily)
VVTGWYGFVQRRHRLARVVARPPDEPEVQGLVGLMELRRRRDARSMRTATSYRSNRTARWDPRIAGAVNFHAKLTGVWVVPSKAIAACHATGGDASETDWAQIARLYAELALYAPGPIVELNRAVAVAMSGDLPNALGMVEALSSIDALSDYYLLPATHADILRRLGRVDDARAAYGRALDLAMNEADRRLLARRLDELPAE